MQRVTSHSVQVARRSGIGRSLELTPEDRAAMARKDAERKARLARIAGEPTLDTPTLSTVQTPDNTRPHRVVRVGQQHADDQAPMGQCVVCETVGEWNALTDLAPNAYGCSGRAPYDY